MKCLGIDAISGAYLELEFGEVITGVDELIRPLIDAPYVAPGFIDLQVNGFAGVDYNDPEAPHEEIARSIRVLNSTGVTRFFPTVITGAPERISGALRNLARAREAITEGESMEGFHVEGPHISPEDGARGAHPRAWVRPPDIDEYRRWQEASGGLVKLVTVSPDWPAVTRYIEDLVRDGVVVAIGHTGANTAQIEAAVNAGATLSTHLGNGAHSSLPRHPNYIWDQLAEDRLSASFIVDGHHLPAAFLRVALRAKGVMRSVLVTDATMPAGAQPGPYKLGEVDVELTFDNRVVVRGETRLAGSGIRMDRELEIAMRQTGISLAEAVTMATRNPARVGRLPGRMRGLTTGERADLVLFRFDSGSRTIAVEQTYVGGREVYCHTASR